MTRGLAIDRARVLACLCFFVGATVQGRLLQQDRDAPCACTAIYDPVCDQTTGEEYSNAQCAVNCFGALPENLEKGQCTAATDETEQKEEEQSLDAGSDPAIPCACTTLWAPVCDASTGTEYPNRQCAQDCHGAEPENLKEGPCEPEPCACADVWDPVCDLTTGKQYSNRDCAACEGADVEGLGACEPEAQEAEKAAEPPCQCMTLWDPVCDLTTGEQYSNKGCAACEGANMENLGACEPEAQEAEIEAVPMKDSPCACITLWAPVCDKSTGERYDNEQCAVGCHGADPDNLEPCAEPVRTEKFQDAVDRDVCIAPPIVCTLDFNECGVSSLCQCPPGYEYSSQLGQCLADLVSTQGALPPAVPNKPGALDALLQSPCAVDVGIAVPCTEDVNACGNPGFCVCPEGHVYDPRTALCLKTQ